MINTNYTFIIPHKNCPDLLKRCIDSIPEREDIQIIVVDDNSDADKKPSIKREEVEIVLLDAEHSKGAGRARNVGLEHAKGKWLLFADSDDYFTDYLSQVLDRFASDDNTDMVFLNTRMFNEKGETKKLNLNVLIKNYINGVEGAENELRYGFWTPWSRMVKRSIVTSYGITFDETMARNDKNFVLECSSYVKTVEAEENFVYNYFRPSYGSQTDRKRTVSILDDMIAIVRRTNEIYDRAGYKHKYSYLQLFWKTSFVSSMSKKDIFCKYLSTLCKNGTNLCKDIYFFIKNRNS